MISENELRNEMEIADQECSAYRMLIAAFKMLQGLSDKISYQIEIAKYEDKLIACEEYFLKLTDVFRKHFVPTETIEIEE